jgi:hypothetical protein
MQDNTAPAAASTAAPGKDEFVKVEGGGPDRTSAEGSVILAYSLMWLIMVVFVWRTIRAQTSLGAEVDNLMRTLKKGAP